MNRTLLAASLAILCACDSQAKKKSSDYNYMSDADMDRIMQIFRDELGADAEVTSLHIGRSLATVYPQNADALEVRLDKVNRPNYRGGDSGFPGVLLSSLDPKATRDKIMALSGCTAPDAIGIGTHANGVLQSSLLCNYNSPQEAIYTMNAQGQLLPELDLQSGEGIVAAWEEIHSILPPDAIITMWGINFLYPGGELLVSDNKYTTQRFGTREKHDNALLIQAKLPLEMETPKNYVKAGDIKPEALKRILAQTKETCGGMDSITLEIGRERGAHFLAGILHKCVIKTDLDGNIQKPGK